MPPPSHNDDVLLGESRDYIHCDNEDCNKPGARKRCTGCKCAFYCSIACQRADWKSQHKQVCKRMQRQNTQTTVAMQADQIDAGGAAAATATATDTTSDVDVCAICLGPPVAPCPLPDCQHEFCYACLGELQTSAIASSTMPVGENMPCPLCRKPSVPLDILYCMVDAAQVYTNRAGRIRQHKSCYGPTAEATMQEALTAAGAILDDALAAGVDAETGQRDAFYYNVMFKRAEHAVATGDCAKAVALMADSAQSFGSPEGGFHWLLKTENGRGNFCEHLLLLAIAHVENADFESAIPALQKCMTEMGNWRRDAKMERELFAQYARCMFEVGQYEKAVDMGSAAIEMNRTYENSHRYVALAQKAAGDLEGAIETMRQAVVYETPWDAENVEAQRGLLAELLVETA